MVSTPKPMVVTKTIDATPGARELWHGIAGHFDSLTQVLCEFVDNSVSDLHARNKQPRSVQINIEGRENESVVVSVEDSGSGIGDLSPVMRLGDTSLRKTPLNEHGFGLKHALASADPSNSSWQVFTRIDDEFKNGRYRRLSAPYSFSMVSAEVDATNEQWPGGFNGSGTLIRFKTNWDFFNTIQKGIRGQAGFKRCLEYLVEELGYVYAGVIEKGGVTLSVTSSAAGFNQVVQSVKPAIVDYYAPGKNQEKVDLGGGTLTIEYEFAQIDEGQYAKHYMKNLSTSGVEIRINGRLMMANIFKEIWALENHPMYNHFLAIINLVGDDSRLFPQTRTSKNGMRSGDEKLSKLFDFIRNTHPNPQKVLANATREQELVRELAAAKEVHIRNASKHIETEFRVFKTLGDTVPVDLYVFDGTDVVLYEAKKDTADVQDLYQLLMYWDGAVEDGILPAEGILLASDFSPAVDVMLKVINATNDRKGRPYKLSRKTWSEEGIKYPR